MPKKDSRKDFEKHSLEHVLSFQRRVLHTKRVFMHRGQRTPLGIVEDYWDRTEAGRDMHSDFSRAKGSRFICCILLDVLGRSLGRHNEGPVTRTSWCISNGCPQLLLVKYHWRNNEGHSTPTFWCG